MLSRVLTLAVVLCGSLAGAVNLPGAHTKTSSCSEVLQLKTKANLFDSERSVLTLCGEDESSKFSSRVFGVAQNASCNDQNVKHAARTIAAGQIILAGGKSDSPIIETALSRRGNGSRTSTLVSFSRTTGVVTRSISVRVLCENGVIVSNPNAIENNSVITSLPRARD